MSKKILLDKTTFNPDESSDWLWLVEKTIALDKASGTPNGWHWFWVIYYLQKQNHIPNFDFEKIENTLPEEHWRITQKKEDYEWKQRGENALYKSHDLGVIYAPQPNRPASKKKMAVWAKKVQMSKKITRINFFDAPFYKSIDFSSFIFPVDTSFEKTQFFNEVNFRNTIFLKDALFNDAKFLTNVRFNGAKFCETADFEGAIFHKNTSHSKETAKFRNTTFSKIANFRNAVFWGYANFKGAKLAGRAFFQDATFKYHAPRFYDATFNNEMTWAGIKLPNFAEAPVDNYEKVDNVSDEVKRVTPEKAIKNHRRRIEENQNSYENTSILLKKQGKYHDQHFFFREEMRCRRWLGDDFNHAIYRFYEWFADYGYGVGHALIWWLLNMGVGFYMLMHINHKGYSMVDNPIRCSFFTSIANAHSFLFFHNGPLKSCYRDFKHLPDFTFIWAAQTIVGIPLLFLVLLTLRTRFRINNTK